MASAGYDHSSRVWTRAEIEAEYGSLPPAITQHFTWTVHRSHASVTWVTDDGGEHWARKSVLYAAERARREEEALEQQRIQREEKG